MYFQLLLIAGVVLIALFAVRALPGEKSLAIKRILAILFILTAAVAVLFPEVLGAVANFFGIGRGTDLLLYGAVMLGMLFAVMIVRAKARSEARVTELARAVALMEARLREQQPEKQVDE